MNDDAKQRALRILERRDVSRKMLLDKLAEKGIEPYDAEEVADWLCGLGVVDDRRFAGLVVRSCARKGYGERRIREELYQKGIPRELWDSALEELPPADDTVYQLLQRKMAAGAELPKIRSFLLRRGFSWEEISAAEERYRSENEEQI